MGNKQEMAKGYCLPCYQIKRAKEHVLTIKTQQEATQYAIAWQQWASNQSLSYGELSEWSAIFCELSEKYNLENEFHENGIL